MSCGGEEGEDDEEAPTETPRHLMGATEGQLEVAVLRATGVPIVIIFLVSLGKSQLWDLCKTPQPPPTPLCPPPNLDHLRALPPFTLRNSFVKDMNCFA